MGIFPVSCIFTKFSARHSHTKVMETFSCIDELKYGTLAQSITAKIIIHTKLPADGKYSGYDFIICRSLKPMDTFLFMTPIIAKKLRKNQKITIQPLIDESDIIDQKIGGWVYKNKTYNSLFCREDSIYYGKIGG